ncbi:MAG: hypothetical protein AAGF13_06810 [Pseudomonadota bacterium]
MSHLIPLSSFVFDGSHPSLYRDRLGEFRDRAPNYDDRYDFHTFCYDCFYQSSANEVWLLCPRLINFQILLPNLTFAIDGAEHKRVKVEHLSRASIIRLKAVRKRPESVSFKHPLFAGELAVNGEEFERFEGTNAVFSINKNNELEWIKDWLRYYVRAHRGNAVILCDNASTDYTAQELADAMASVEGIQAAAVIPCPFPFGPNAEGRANTDSLFLQRSMGELIRRRFLGRARAVLNVDIDELFYSRSGRSIFDVTATSEAGYVRADAEWIYPKTEPNGTMRHAFHSHLSATRKPKANRKWCVAPQGPQKDAQWRTHFLSSQKDPVDPDFLMLHCRNISTSWKYDRGSTDEIELEHFPEFDTHLRQVFPEYF